MRRPSIDAADRRQRTGRQHRYPRVSKKRPQSFPNWGLGFAETIARVRMTDPATYRVVASILPKDVLVNVQQQTPGNLDPDEWRVLVGLVRLIKASAPEGSQALPTEIVPAIEENRSSALREAGGEDQ